MQLPLLYVDSSGENRCYQWDLDDFGRQTCKVEAILATDDAAVAVMQKSRGVETLLTQVEAYEAAPDDAAPDAIKALALWRAGEPDAGTPEHDAWAQAKAVALSALATEAAKPLAVDPRPVPEAISRRQFGFGAVMVGKMTQAEALAFVNSGTLPAAVEAIVQSLPADQQFAARMSLASNEFHRHNPATLMFLPLMQIDDATADACWRYGATFA